MTLTLVDNSKYSVECLNNTKFIVHVKKGINKDMYVVHSLEHVTGSTPEELKQSTKRYVLNCIPSDYLTKLKQ